MATRPSFKQENSFGPSGPAYEMKPGSAGATMEALSDETASAEDSVEAVKKGTHEDQKDMYRMNKVRSIDRLSIAPTVRIDRSNSFKNFAATSASCPSSAIA